MTAKDLETVLTKVVRGVLESPNELDRNSEPANVVDGLFAIAEALNGVARSLEAIAYRPSEKKLNEL